MHLARGVRGELRSLGGRGARADRTFSFPSEKDPKPERQTGCLFYAQTPTSDEQASWPLVLLK